MAFRGKNPKLEIRPEIFMKKVLIAFCFLTGCSAARHLTGEDMTCLEARDENEPSIFQIDFDSVAVVDQDSLNMRGRISTSAGNALAGASVQFGLWKTVEEGAYFIVREEFIANLDGRFAFATRVRQHEWMVIETLLGNRFFRIADVLSTGHCP